MITNIRNKTGIGLGLWCSLLMSLLMAACSNDDEAPVEKTPQLTIIGFSPEQGMVGDEIVIKGTAFGNSPEVTFFDSVKATVSSFTDSTITVSVPEGSETGAITVATGSNSATSSKSFTLLPSTPPLTITGFTPKEGKAGDEITIEGTAFGSNPEVVFFDDVSATISSSTDSKITVVVPEEAKTGKIELRVNGQTVASTDEFTILDSSEESGFVTTWLIQANDTDLTIPVDETGEAMFTDSPYTYNYTVDWGDGTTPQSYTGSATHTYDDPGTYTVTITGEFPHIYFNRDSEGLKLRTIEAWGTIQWRSFEAAFSGCANLVVDAVDTPDLSQVQVMKSAFSFVRALKGLENWDVSTITNMGNMFENADFNDPKVDLNSWDVSNVTDMGNMFSRSNFNGIVSSWNVSKVTNMQEMFDDANDFNQDISQWDVSSVTNMARMFFGCFQFNQDLSNWDVSNVTDMRSMFAEAFRFDQDLGNWDVGNVTNMFAMFAATAFNHDISEWNVSNVVNMSNMFTSTTAFNQPLNDWDVRKVENMEFMFKDAISFDIDLNGWNGKLDNVTNCEGFADGAPFALSGGVPSFPNCNP